MRRIAPPMVLDDPVDTGDVYRYLRPTDPAEAAARRAARPGPKAERRVPGSRVVAKVLPILKETWPDARICGAWPVDDVPSFRSVWGIERALSNTRGDVARAGAATILLRAASQAEPGQIVACVAMLSGRRWAVFVHLSAETLLVTLKAPQTATLHRAV